MKKIALLTLIMVILVTFTGYADGQRVEEVTTGWSNVADQIYNDYTYEVNPATFDIVIDRNGMKEHVSVPLSDREFSEFKEEGSRKEWIYPKDKVKIIVDKQGNYLNVNIQSIGAKQFTWPTIEGKEYVLPLWEGKQIPNNDPSWKSFLNEKSREAVLKKEPLRWMEWFSMNFMAVNKADYSLIYIIDNPFNDEVSFQTNPTIQMMFTHEFPSIQPRKEYGFRIYVTNNDPVTMAKLYKNYVQEKKQFKTLVEKANDNPNIKKLYGAPHVYLWNENLLVSDNFYWKKMKKKLDHPIWPWIEQLLGNDGAKELQDVRKAVRTGEPLNAYYKRVIVRALDKTLKSPQFYHPNKFPSIDEALRNKFAVDKDKISEQQLYTCNKILLKSVFQDAVDDISKWGQAAVNLVRDMKQAGIGKAWIGLPSWSDGLMNPTLVETASKQDYLMGPYDSYHSIHNKDEKNTWDTAQFEDHSSYKQETITDEKGVKIAGFLQRGRKLNPTLSLRHVKRRVNKILKKDTRYNSWFIDCDATGEIYDDYSPEHITTQEQDKDARLARMQYIAKEKKMVIGSEGGHDFASQVIAFAHGIQTPPIAWESDRDMYKKKNNIYYVGKPFSTTGGVPDSFAKQVPVKPQYHPIYLDERYSVPLSKLVYNDSFISTYHWAWDSFKIKGKVVNRRLKELLHNIPPLYHLDVNRWKEFKKEIVRYNKVWSPFHKKAVTKEMTSFRILSSNRLLQSAEYGSDLKVIVNFSDEDMRHEGYIYKAKSAVIYDGDKKTEFKATV